MSVRYNTSAFKQLFPPVQPQSNLIGLILSARGRGMGRQIAGRGDEHMPCFESALQQPVLADCRFDRLDGVEILIFA
jgi:hypothetical protein